METAKEWLAFAGDYPELSLFAVCLVIIGFTVHTFKAMLKSVWTTQHLGLRRITVTSFAIGGGWFLTQYLFSNLEFPHAKLWAVAVALTNSSLYDILIRVSISRGWMGTYAFLKGRKVMPKPEGGFKVMKEEPDGSCKTEIMK